MQEFESMSKTRNKYIDKMYFIVKILIEKLY